MSDDDKKKSPGEITRTFNIGNVLLLDAGVRPDQLNEAIDAQKQKPHMKIGEILMAMGALTPKALKAALEKQAVWRKRGPSAKDVNRMADLAAEHTQAVADQLEELESELERAKK